MTENQIAKTVVDAAYKVHLALGPGLLESVYEVILAHELRKRGLKVERQKSIPIKYDGMTFEEGFRADLVVEDKVICELKSVQQESRVFKKVVLTQLRLTGLRLGLLVNFGADRIGDGISGIVNGLPDESPQ